MAHLDRPRLQALLRGDAADPALAEHLAAGCDECDALLAAHADALDGAADALLLAASAHGEAPLDEVAWQRLRRALRGPRRASRVGALVALAAAVAAGAFGLLRSPAASPDDGVKGRDAWLQLEVSAALRASDGALRRLDAGASVPASGVLLLRVHATDAAEASLWLERAGGAVTRLGGVALQAGTHDLEREGRLTGISLEGERGQVTVWVVAGKGASTLVPAEAQRRVQSGERADVAVGRFVVVVEPVQ